LRGRERRSEQMPIFSMAGFSMAANMADGQGQSV
jgi:hypothetical protein